MKLEIRNLHKKYGKKEILKNVNIELETGEILALVGRNGSGKTTLLKTIVGMISKDKGEIFIDNKNIYNNPKLMRELLFIPDRFDYFKYSKIKKVANYYKLIYPQFDKQYFYSQLKEHNFDINKRFSQLSKGETVLISIFLGLACKTKFIFLDEPLDGIDIININKVLDFILEAQEREIGVIVSSHQLSKLEKISNKIYYLGKEDLATTSEVDADNYLKYQVVYDSLDVPELFSNKNVAVLSNIGRVYVIVVDSNFVDFEEELMATKPLQFDRLPATLEDIFILKNK